MDRPVNKALKSRMADRIRYVHRTVKLLNELLAAGKHGMSYAAIARCIGATETGIRGVTARLCHGAYASQVGCEGGHNPWSETIRTAGAEGGKRWHAGESARAGRATLKHYLEITGDRGHLPLAEDGENPAHGAPTLVLEAIEEHDTSAEKASSFTNARERIAGLNSEQGARWTAKKIVDVHIARIEHGESPIPAQARRRGVWTNHAAFSEHEHSNEYTVPCDIQRSAVISICRARRVERRVVLGAPGAQMLRAQMEVDLGSKAGWRPVAARAQTYYVGTAWLTDEIAGLHGRPKTMAPPPDLAKTRWVTIGVVNEHGDLSTHAVELLREELNESERLQSAAGLSADQRITSIEDDDAGEHSAISTERSLSEVLNEAVNNLDPESARALAHHPDAVRKALVAAASELQS